MPDRAVQYPSSRPSRRHDRRGSYDIADLYEARLLAHGMRSEDFLSLRSSTELPPLPDITPIRFGRGTDSSPLPAIAVVEPERSAGAVSAEESPPPTPES
jgi:hypothetical protein